MTRHPSFFTHLDKSEQLKVKLENGEIVQVKRRRTFKLNTNEGIKFISNVLFLPELEQNVLGEA